MEQLDPQRYHTHPEPDTPICVAFLHGTCQFTAGCPRHHTLLPYHWQLRWAESGRWESLPPLLQELLERLYCNPEHHHVMLLHQSVLMTVDMESMTVQPPLPFTALRRLSTRGVLGGPLHIPYTFYWWDDPCWREYQVGAGRTAGGAPSQGAKEAKPEAAASQQPAVQESQGMRQKARKLRPVFRALVTMLPHLRSFPETCFWGSPTGLPPMQDSQYPTTWASMDPSMDFIQVNLSLDDRTYLIIHQLFHHTLPELKYQLLSVSRVQNRFLWDKYKRKKEYMCRNPVEEEQRGHERHLFHGTAGEAVRGICKHGFDPRLSGKHAAVFGLGTYFTRSASLANRYALPDPQGAHYLFLSKVLVGRWAQGKASLRRPPALQPDNPASDLYDSCVDRVADPSIYILFDSDQCYPYFLLTYRKVEPVIVLA
nr:PREDICTED: TCDD-inducible poly [ADP-ribose] polymerase-like [Lepisosteus oculatus]